MSDRNNMNYRLIRGALALTRPEVVECLRLADMTVSADTPRRWASHPEEGARRYTRMSDEEFDAFVNGLSLLMFQRRREQGQASDGP